VRCPGPKTQGREYCSAHAATLCKWKANDGSLCAAEAGRDPGYCTTHCWCESSSPLLSQDFHRESE
jgi:hypothetical protein